MIRRTLSHDSRLVKVTRHFLTHPNHPFLVPLPSRKALSLPFAMLSRVVKATIHHRYPQSTLRPLLSSEIPSTDPLLLSITTYQPVDLPLPTTIPHIPDRQHQVVPVNRDMRERFLLRKPKVTLMPSLINLTRVPHFTAKMLGVIMVTDIHFHHLLHLCPEFLMLLGGI
jgi:hypothetical protein